MKSQLYWVVPLVALGIVAFDRPAMHLWQGQVGGNTHLAHAQTTIAIAPGRGVGGASLGTRESEAVSALSRSLGRPAASGRDTEYEGQTVYYNFFGNRTNNVYPLRVYSDAQRRVFIFEINSPQFVTSEGIRVGSSEQALSQAYGNNLSRRRSRIYTQYSLGGGGGNGTDFYVRNGVVTQILVRSY